MVSQKQLLFILCRCLAGRKMVDQSTVSTHSEVVANNQTAGPRSKNGLTADTAATDSKSTIFLLRTLATCRFPMKILSRSVLS